MKFLKSLDQHLRDKQLIDDDSFDSWSEDGSLEPSFETVRSGVEPVMLALRMRYTAVFSWEGFTGSAMDLFLTIMVWLSDQDYDFDELGEPTFDAEMVDNQSADVEISISFIEAVHAKKDDNGEWVVTDDIAPNIVETASVCGSAST